MLVASGNYTCTGRPSVWHWRFRAFLNGRGECFWLEKNKEKKYQLPLRKGQRCKRPKAPDRHLLSKIDWNRNRTIYNQSILRRPKLRQTFFCQISPHFQFVSDVDGCTLSSEIQDRSHFFCLNLRSVTDRRFPTTRGPFLDRNPLHFVVKGNWQIVCPTDSCKCWEENRQHFQTTLVYEGDISTCWLEDISGRHVNLTWVIPRKTINSLHVSYKIYFSGFTYLYTLCI